MTDYKNELEKALEKLKFTVLNRKVTEKDWESEIFFEVTSEFKATIEALLSKRELEATIKGIEMYAWMKDGTYYVGTTGKTLKEAVSQLTNREER